MSCACQATNRTETFHGVSPWKHDIITITSTAMPKYPSNQRCAPHQQKTPPSAANLAASHSNNVVPETLSVNTRQLFNSSHKTTSQAIANHPINIMKSPPSTSAHPRMPNATSARPAAIFRLYASSTMILFGMTLPYCDT